MRKYLTLIAAVAACFSMGQGVARAAHNLVTLSAPTVTRIGSDHRLVRGRISIRNTTSNAQTGHLVLILFGVQPNGTVAEAARQDLGTVDLPATQNATVTVDYNLVVAQTGYYIALGDYASSIGGNIVPHTHSGTFPVQID